MSDMSETHRALIQKDAQYVWHPFTQMAGWLDDRPLVIEAGEGAWLIDVDGRRYLDAISSLWTNVHGHRRKEIDAAVRAQLERIAHSTLLGLANVPSIELAERLVAVAPPGLQHVFYSDSGSTAVEVALKVTYQYWQQQGEVHKKEFATLREAYHGDTIGSVSLGGIDLFHKTYKALLFDSHKVDPFDGGESLERVFREHGERLAAFVLEPLVQGAAGMLVHPEGFLKRVRELCDAYDVFLVADEVATGFGRTGTLFACEQEGVAPDVLCLAKGVSGGYLPLAATLFTSRIYEGFLGEYGEFKTFFHGHTYTGNPLACAAALASLRIFETDRVLENLRPKVAHLRERLVALSAHERVVEVRQKGLMVGIEIGPYEPAARMGHRVCMAARDRNVILRPLGDVIVLMPPLCITTDEIDLMVDAVEYGFETVLEAA
ncbi:MAG: adenosylmethionine--8-amino-7-oxononanoate transaminase [Deltaproteobacteria bacterium]|nr:MAG: adenosylmethionine--8-amino-7-oxononanoate transaminase [Deltaproteobacteria bacterium]